MVYMELRLFSQFVAVNKMYAVFIIFSEVSYIINNVRLIPGTYYLTAIIVNTLAKVRSKKPLLIFSVLAWYELAILRKNRQTYHRLLLLKCWCFVLTF